jgi:GrpB-like predicted nucleotidyltransferase (UPF0157 family)
VRVEIATYDPQWPLLFQRERTALQETLGTESVIEHIGSTAVPLLAAKPIIDIQIGVPNLEAFDQSEAAACVEKLDYTHRTDLQTMVPHRRFFMRRGHADQPDVNIHLVARDHPWWDRHLLFRDYLRENAEARIRYEFLKLELAARDWPNIGAYTDAKSGLIIELEEEAFDHFGVSEARRAVARSGRVN